MTDGFHILLLNSPNISVLSTRKPGKHGTLSSAGIVDRLTSKAAALNVSLDHLQSDVEYTLIDRIHQAKGNVDYILISPATFVHTNVVIHDALFTVSIPFIEVHLNNVHACEPFHQHSYLSDVAADVTYGLGADGYLYILQTAIKRLS